MKHQLLSWKNKAYRASNNVVSTIDPSIPFINAKVKIAYLLTIAFASDNFISDLVKFLLSTSSKTRMRNGITRNESHQPESWTMPVAFSCLGSEKKLQLALCLMGKL